jgi:hemerythrin superfamily protein
MNALDLLTQQHRETDGLFADLKRARAENKQDRFADLADALAIHTTLEETLFYPAAMEKADEILEEQLRAAAEEHLGLKRILADMLEFDLDDPAFTAKLEVLEEQVSHHVREEEQQMFPRVRAVLDREAMAALGEAMETVATQLVGRDPRNAIPRQTLSAAPVEGKGGREAA